VGNISPIEAGLSDGQSKVTENESNDFGDIKISYLLISPLQGLVTKLATMWSKAPRVKAKDLSNSKDATCDIEEKLVQSDTLAIFGDEDIFSPNKKLRLWADRLANEDSRFRHVEITGAGHFWHEEGVVNQMRSNVQEFVSGL
jgi:pimeloyl-ACP methyl ester carboxylesterase